MINFQFSEIIIVLYVKIDKYHLLKDIRIYSAFGKQKQYNRSLGTGGMI